nr:unnamed protein product [Digitaria exilis]
MERTHSSDMSVSMAAPRGRSERSTGGREREATAEGREARKARWVEEAVEAKVMSVEVTPWRVARRLASSAMGIRWPIPGVTSIATCGGELPWKEVPLPLAAACSINSGGECCSGGAG